MTRQIELLFPTSNVKLTASMLDNEAPNTCEAVWSVLLEESTFDSIRHWPEQGRVYHGIYAGPELYTFIPPGRTTPPLENFTWHPIPGDILLVLVPATAGRWVDAKGELWDFAFFYDRGANMSTSGPDGLGWKGSRFAQVRREDLDELMRIGKKIRFKGEENMIIRRKP